MSELEHDMEALKRIEELEETKASALANLLDEKILQQEKYIALRTEMGKTSAMSFRPVPVASWVTTHTLEWVGKNLRMGSQMPFMQSYIDENGRIRVDQRNADELKQRAPDWTRQPELAAYLLHDRQRKFSTILAVVCPPWVDDPSHSNWGIDARAVENAIKVKPLDTEGRVGLLDLKDTAIYALDGQHRVMGIRGVTEVRDNGLLEMRRRDGTSTNKHYTREDLLERFRVEIGEMQAVLNETISVEYIPAVIAGETREEANRRIRDVFVCINSYARKTKVGETILLDESDGFSIVARKIGTRHSLFRSDSEQRVNWENNSISKAAHYYTTLDAIRTIAEQYLTMTDYGRYGPWLPLFKDQVPLRPTQEELDDAYKSLSRLFDLLESLPVFQSLRRGTLVTDVREFPTESNPNRKGHMLLRPIGQQVLGHLVSTIEHSAIMPWERMKEKLEKADKSGAFSIHLPENLWYHILYDPRKGSVIARGGNRELAKNLLIYLLKGADEKERRELLEQVVEKRRDETGEKWMGFDGSWTDKSLTDTSLPPPIS